MAIDLLPVVLPIPGLWTGALVTVLVLHRVFPRSFRGADRFIERSFDRRKRRK